MYEALIGDRIKELVMIKMIMQNTENYILKVGENSAREIEPNPILLELADKISEVLALLFRVLDLEEDMVAVSKRPHLIQKHFHHV